MSDKLLNPAVISTQVEFDQFGGFKLTEVLDADVLEAVGGGDGKITVDLPNIQLYCPTTNTPCPITNNCPPPSGPPAPAPTPSPTPTPPKKEEPKPGEDGDEE